MKRQRGRGRRSGGNSNNPNKHFESNGPDVKIRGSAQQILDKYQQYARDAQSAGDRVNAENYLQHAEHYYRVLAAIKPPEKQQRDDKGDNQNSDKSGQDGNEAKSSSDDGSKRDEKDNRDNNRGRGRGRSRRDRDEAETDEKKSAEANDDADAGDTEETSAKEEKPKRRRTYKKKSADDAETSGSDDGDDGVMKTLSRGRSKSSEPAEDGGEAAKSDEAAE